VNLEIAGVDLLFERVSSDTGEVNSEPDFAGLEQAADLNMASTILEHCCARIAPNRQTVAIPVAISA
jgi:glutathione synthase/RimK-type ligase-like ATP-grasp enzyme